MSSTERISFLQEKLQEIRKYYMSLKSEVATIDRRRKRLKKKDREGNVQFCFMDLNDLHRSRPAPIILCDSVYASPEIFSIFHENTEPEAIIGQHSGGEKVVSVIFHICTCLESVSLTFQNVNLAKTFTDCIIIVLWKCGISREIMRRVLRRED